MKMRSAISIFSILRTGVVGRNIHMRQICYDQLDETMRKVPTALSPVIAVDRKASRPLHKQIYDAYRAMIVARNFGAGQQIPSTRALATELRISRIPVLTAYSQLLAEGYFEARVGAGTFVCASLPEQLTFNETRASQSNQVRSGSRPVAKRASLWPPYESFAWARNMGPFSASQAAYDHFP